MISLILVYKSDRSSSEFDLEDDFSLLERLYKNQPKNVVFFEQAFDCMVNIQNKAQRYNSLILNPIDIFSTLTCQKIIMNTKKLSYLNKLQISIFSKGY